MSAKGVEWSCTLSCFGRERIEVESARVYEALSVPYEAALTVILRAEDVDIAQVLGCDCVITLDRSEMQRRVPGIVRDVRSRRGDLDESTVLELTVVPALALLALRRDSRIFQDLSVPDVLRTVLGDALAPYGREVTLDQLSEEHPVRDYFLQYQETDLDFAHRLMEEEGIGYSFEVEGDVEKLVLRDVSSTFPEIETPSGRPVLAFDPHVHEVTSAGNIYELRRVMRPTLARAATRGRDFKTARRVDGSADGEPGRSEREDYAHQRGRLLRVDGESKTYARRGLEGDRERGVELRGHARAIGLSAGRRFQLENHPLVGMDGEYLVTEVVHRTVGPGEEHAPRDGYVAELTAIPAHVPWRRLRRTPKPKVGSVETATVVGPAGDEIHTDEHGRVKVQLHWDRVGKRDEHSTCWLRVRQAWAGPGWGFLFIPRIGMEVVVMFLEGDPDRPVVGGCLYNAANTPPYELPAEKTKSTIKSNSSPGGGGFNELRFEDKKGQEQIYTHAQKDQDEEVLHDHSTTVGHDQTNEVTGDQHQEVGRHQIETVHVDQTMTVLQKRTVDVKGKFDETVKGHETRTVLGGVEEILVGFEKRKVSGGLKETRLGDETKMVLRGIAETIHGDLTQAVVGSVAEASTGMLSMTATDPVTVLTLGLATYQAGGPMMASFGGTLAITAPPKLQWNTPTRIEFQGMVTSSKAISVGITLLNTGIAGTATGMAGLSIDLTKVKAEATGAAIGIQNAALGVVGASAAAIGVNIALGAFEMKVAGIFAS